MAEFLFYVCQILHKIVEILIRFDEILTLINMISWRQRWDHPYLRSLEEICEDEVVVFVEEAEPFEY